MRAALIQLNAVSDKVANLAAAEALIDRAVARERPDLIALPEVFDWQGGTADQKRAAAEPEAGGPAWTMLSQAARRHGVFIHGGSFLEHVPGEDRLFNTSVVFDRAGREIARYRKIHLFDIVTPDGTAYRESATIRAGDAVVTVDLEGVRFGLAICYDLRFPELFRALAERGAQAILLPASFTLQTGKDHWEPLIRARAIETQCWWLAPAQTGSFPTPAGRRDTYGHAMIVDPWGLVVARASDGPGVVAATLDPDRVAAVRAGMPIAAHRAARGFEPV